MNAWVVILIRRLWVKVDMIRDTIGALALCVIIYAILIAL